MSAADSMICCLRLDTLLLPTLTAASVRRRITAGRNLFRLSESCARLHPSAPSPASSGRLLARCPPTCREYSDRVRESHPRLPSPSPLYRTSKTLRPDAI